MNIGITTSSNINPYACVLIYKLKEDDNIPVSVFHVERTSPRKYLINKIKYGIHRAGLTYIVGRLRRADHQADGKNYLGDFAKANNINDINLPLTEVCRRENIEYVKGTNINSRHIVDSVKEQNIDILINAGGGIFGNSIINAPRIGILNAHMGYLPKFRGFNVLEWSLFYKEAVGVTLHFIARGIDTGDILLFKSIPVEKGDTILSLRKKSGLINVELMLESIRLLKHKKAKRIRQLPEEGKQYFVMHHRLRKIAENKLQNNFERRELQL